MFLVLSNVHFPDWDQQRESSFGRGIITMPGALWPPCYNVNNFGLDPCEVDARLIAEPAGHPQRL